MKLTKKYILTIESAPNTRWPFPDAFLLEALRRLCGAVISGHSTGPDPRITITEDEAPETTITENPK